MERLSPLVPQTEAGLWKQLKHKTRTHDRIEVQTLMRLSMSLIFLKWGCGCCSDYGRNAGAPWRFGFAGLGLLGVNVSWSGSSAVVYVTVSDNLKCAWCHSLCIRVVFMEIQFTRTDFCDRQKNNHNCEDSSLSTVLTNFLVLRIEKHGRVYNCAWPEPSKS